MTETRGAYRRGAVCLVDRFHHALPSVCVRCGAPAGDGRVKVRVHWHSPWAFAALVLSPLIYAIVAGSQLQSVTLQLPLCERHAARRRRGLQLAAAAAVAGFVALCAGIVFLDELLGLVSVLGGGAVIVAAVLAALLVSRSASVATIDSRYAHLRAHPRFAGALPEAPNDPALYDPRYVPAPPVPAADPEHAADSPGLYARTHRWFLLDPDAHQFPNRCVLCNAPAHPERVEQVVKAGRRRVLLRVPLCSVHRRARQRRFQLGLALFVLAVASVPLAWLVAGNPGLIVAGLVAPSVMLVLLVGLPRARAVVRVLGMHGRFISLHGAGSAFVATLPPAEGSEGAASTMGVRYGSGPAVPTGPARLRDPAIMLGACLFCMLSGFAVDGPGAWALPVFFGACAALCLRWLVQRYRAS